MKPPRLVIWDLDGTLIDSGRDIVSAANRMRAELGRPPLPEQTLLGYIGEGAARLVDKALGEHEPQALRQEGLERFLRLYAERLCESTAPFEGIDAIVRALAGRQAIATNKPGPLARRLVGLLGWEGLFASVIGTGDVAHRKPAPDMALQAMALYGARPEETVFVGDTPIDIATAHAAGIDCICVTWGPRPGAEILHAPCRVDTAGELAARLGV